MIILVAIRIGEGSRAAVHASAKLARQIGAELKLLYVSEEMEAVEELARAAGQRAEEVRQRMLEEIRERCYIEIGKPFPMDAELIVRQGDIAEQVTKAAVDLGAELIVVGMKGRSALAKLVLGDATGAILERAPCPVVVIPPAIAHPTN